VKIYLAGPMTGYPQFNYPAFHQAASSLRKEGHFVFSPAERDIERDGKNWGDEVKDGSAAAAKEKGFDLRSALGDDLEFICKDAEAIALLPGWEKSSGAQAEWATARALGLKFIYL